MALALSWTGYADTELEFSEFFDSDHTLCVRFMLQCPRGYQGPFIAENGSGTFFLGQGIFDKDDMPSPNLLLIVGSASVNTPVRVISDTWYHLAMTAQVSAAQRVFKLYLNGARVGEQLVVTPETSKMPKGTLRFGKRTTGMTVQSRNAQCYGLLADIAVFGKVLSDATIGAQAARTAHLGGGESELIAGYTFADGPQPAKLARPATLRGAATRVAISADWNDEKDAKLIPLPTHQQPMDLPFPPGEAWRSKQAWNGNGSHTGKAGFCWDFYIEPDDGKYPKGSDGAPFYAAAPGIVLVATEGADSGMKEGKDYEKNYIDIEQASGEIASYIHLRKNSLEAQVKKRYHVAMGEKLALTGDTGTPKGVFHLHFAVNDKQDGAEGFVTIPVAFSDYEVRASDGTWQTVARGVPGTEQVIRNPPAPTFGTKSLSPASVLARASDCLDVVATDTNGRAWISRWTPNRYARNWDRWRPILTDIGGARTVDVASRGKDQLDVVTADSAGRIYTGACNDKVNHGLWGGWWRIRDLIAKADSLVTIIARDPGKLDVFAVRSDGAISGAAWDRDVADGKWRGWWSIADGATHPGSPITAVARSPHQIDLFVTGLNGGVYTAGWDSQVDGGKWHGWTRVGNLVTLAGARITAVARDAHKLDIFAVRKDAGAHGAICTAAWDRNVDGGKWRGWWQIAGGVALAGAPVTAVARGPAQLDVFVVGKDGGVYSAAYDAKVAQGAWRGWWRIRDLVSHQGSTVAAVAREPAKLDIFAVAKDGRMFTAAWDAKVAEGEWHGWWAIA